MPSKAATWFVSNRFDQNGQIVSKGISTTVPVHVYGNLKFCVTSVAKDYMGHTAESLPICMNRWVLPLGIGQGNPAGAN